MVLCGCFSPALRVSAGKNGFGEGEWEVNSAKRVVVVTVNRFVAGKSESRRWALLTKNISASWDGEVPHRGIT